MNSNHQYTVQTVVLNIAKTIYFTNRWVSISAIVEAIKNRYQLKDMIINKKTISRHLGKLDVDIDNSQGRHLSGIYRRKYNCESYYYFQKPYKEPPTFPPPNDYATWDKIKKLTTNNCSSTLIISSQMIASLDL